MFSSLRLERIGNDRLGHQPAWVKEVSGIEPRRIIETPIDGYADYTNSNSVGSRGVIINYLLQEGHIYHVSAPINFKRRETYFCQVRQGNIVRVEFDEVIKRLIELKVVGKRRLVDPETGEIVYG